MGRRMRVTQLGLIPGSDTEFIVDLDGTLVPAPARRVRRRSRAKRKATTRARPLASNPVAWTGTDANDGSWTRDILVPLRTVSASNAREHWRRRAARVAAERMAIHLVAGQHLRCLLDGQVATITLKRIAPRRLDFDNLAGCLKATIDQVAAELGFRNDADPRLTWQIRQRSVGVREYAVEVGVSVRWAVAAAQESSG